MDYNEEKIKKIINLFREQGLSVRPQEAGLKQVLEKIAVTDNKDLRYSYHKERKVDIISVISPFYYYMNSSMKVLLPLVIIALLVGGVVYFKLAGPITGGESEIAVVKESDNNLESLLASLGQEQSEETQLLAAGDIDNSIFADESLLLGEINQTYQDEL